VLEFDQDAAEEAQVMTALTEAYHTAEDILLVALLIRLVKFFDIKFLRDGDQCFEHAGTQRVFHPGQVQSEYLREHLKQVLVGTFMLHIILIEHRCLGTTSICLMG